jgi:hypothetical protein
MISAEMLGDVATENDVKRLVEILRDSGYDVAEGEPVNNDPYYIPYDVWNEAIKQIGQES